MWMRARTRGQVMELARILVADEDGSFIRDLRAGIGEFADLRCVRCGVDLLEMARAWNPEVVVLDLLLPDIDGFTLLDCLTGSNTQRQPAILCLTGGRGANSRPPRLTSWPVGTLCRTSSPAQIRTALLRAVEAQRASALQSLS